MADKEYSNETLGVILERVEETGKKTLAQAQETNGRVSMLEGWRNAFIAVFGLIILLMGSVYALEKVTIKQTIQNEVREAVASAMDDVNWEIEIE